MLLLGSLLSVLRLVGRSIQDGHRIPYGKYVVVLLTCPLGFHGIHGIQTAAHVVASVQPVSFSLIPEQI